VGFVEDMTKTFWCFFSVHSVVFGDIRLIDMRKELFLARASNKTQG